MTEEEEGCSVRVSPLTSPQLSRQLSHRRGGSQSSPSKERCRSNAAASHPNHSYLPPSPQPRAPPTPPFNPVPYTYPNSHKRGCARTPPPHPRFNPNHVLGPNCRMKKNEGKRPRTVFRGRELLPLPDSRLCVRPGNRVNWTQ